MMSVMLRMKMDQDVIMQALDRSYDIAVKGLPLLGSAQDLAGTYTRGRGSLDDRARRLVRNQVMKAGTSGFLSGLGGVLTMVIAVPANVASVMYVQIQMIAAIAHMGGRNIHDNDEIRTLCYACMCGTAAGDVVKGTGIKLGEKLTEQAIKRISGEVIKNINQKVGFRLVTKFGEKGVINLGKMIPLVGGCVGCAFDSSSTYAIGKIARTTFIGT